MIQIRKAQKQDAPQIAELMLLAMEEIAYYFIGQIDKSEALQFLNYFISQENNQYSYQNCYVAVKDGLVLGQLCIYHGERLQELRAPILSHLSQQYNNNLILEDETQAGELYIDTLAVATLAQGKGIGKILLNYVINHYVVERKETLGLLVEHSNPGAKKLYEDMGFKVVNTVRIFDKQMDHLQLVSKTTV